MNTPKLTEALQYIADDQLDSFDAQPAFEELDRLVNSHASLVSALEGLLKFEGLPVFSVPSKGDCRSFVIPEDVIESARAALKGVSGK